MIPPDLIHFMLWDLSMTRWTTSCPPTNITRQLAKILVCPRMCSKTSILQPATSSVIISRGERGEQEAPHHHFCSATWGGHVHGVASASRRYHHSLRPTGCLVFFRSTSCLEWGRAARSFSCRSRSSPTRICHHAEDIIFSCNKYLNLGTGM
jgi:hypothetical protein